MAAAVLRPEGFQGLYTNNLSHAFGYEYSTQADRAAPDGRAGRGGIFISIRTRFGLEYMEKERGRNLLLNWVFLYLYLNTP